MPRKVSKVVVTSSTTKRKSDKNDDWMAQLSELQGDPMSAAAPKKPSSAGMFSCMTGVYNDMMTNFMGI